MQPVCVQRDHEQRLHQEFHSSQSTSDYSFNSQQVSAIIPESRLLCVAICKYYFVIIQIPVVIMAGVLSTSYG